MNNKFVSTLVNDSVNTQPKIEVNKTLANKKPSVKPKAKKVVKSKKHSGRKTFILKPVFDVFPISKFKALDMSTCYTLNGDFSYSSSGSKLLDCFFKLGGLLKGTEREILEYFVPAFNDNPVQAIMMMFYFRDIRKGQGMRQAFKHILKYLADNHPEYLAPVLDLVPFYGRWDDLWILLNTELEMDVLNLVAEQLNQDIEKIHLNELTSISLLAKWLPSLNAGKKSRKLAKKFAAVFGLTEREYRLTLSTLRSHLVLVETKMCDQLWKQINYSHVPSKAFKLYSKAFKRHDLDRFQDFLDRATSDDKKVRATAKVNAQAIFPYDIVRPLASDFFYMKGTTSYSSSAKYQAQIAQWNNLPDSGTNKNILCVLDVSGSMNGAPIAAALSLGIYTAERNTSKWKNLLYLFSSDCLLIQFKESDNLVDKLKAIARQRVHYGSTNIRAVFNHILDTAQKGKLSSEDMPETLVIISDMEFDPSEMYDSSRTQTMHKEMLAKFEKAGYNLPKLIFWNVSTKTNTTPVQYHESGTVLVSGYSPSIFNTLTGGAFNPLDAMNRVILSERYQPVKAALS